MAQMSGRFNTTTQVWDTSQVEKAGIKDPALKELMIRLYQNLNRMSTALGQSDTGEYALVESLNGQKWFANPNLNSTTTTNPTQRQVFRKVIPFCPTPFPNLPNNAALIQPHGIDVSPTLFFTRIYGVAKNPTGGPNWIPIPWVYPGAPNNAIYVDVNGANVNIRTGDDKTTFTECVVVLEWIQS